MVSRPCHLVRPRVSNDLWAVGRKEETCGQRTVERSGDRSTTGVAVEWLRQVNASQLTLPLLWRRLPTMPLGTYGFQPATSRPSFPSPASWLVPTIRAASPVPVLESSLPFDQLLLPKLFQMFVIRSVGVSNPRFARAASSPTASNPGDIPYAQTAAPRAHFSPSCSPRPTRSAARCDRRPSLAAPLRSGPRHSRNCKSSCRRS